MENEPCPHARKNNSSSFVSCIMEGHHLSGESGTVITGAPNLSVSYKPNAIPSKYQGRRIPTVSTVTPLVYDTVAAYHASRCGVDVRIPALAIFASSFGPKLRNLEMPKLGAIYYDSGPTTLAYDVRNSVACVAVRCGREKGVILGMERGT